MDVTYYFDRFRGSDGWGCATESFNRGLITYFCNGRILFICLFVVVERTATGNVGRKKKMLVIFKVFVKGWVLCLRVDHFLSLVCFEGFICLISRSYLVCSPLPCPRLASV